MTVEIKPNEWLLPNRIGYNKKIYNDFNLNNYKNTKSKSKSKVCDENDEYCDIPITTVNLFNHQKFVRDYLQYDSPYRGLLFYHELGSGKSAASIASIEGYVDKKQIYVMTPASLSTNYFNEIMKISHTGLKLKNKWSLLKVSPKHLETIENLKKYSINYKIIKKDGLIWVPMYKDDIENVEVIKKNISYNSLDKEDKDKVDLTIDAIIKEKYKFVSYNGLTQKLVIELREKTFNDCIIVIDEIHNFISRVVNGSKLARSIYNNIMESNCKIILLSGTPIINNPYEIATLLNLVRGPITVYELSLKKIKDNLLLSEIKDKLTETKLIYFIDEINFNTETNKIYFSLLPKHFIKKEDVITNKEWKGTIEQIIEYIIMSLEQIEDLKIDKKYDIKYFYALPNKKEDFDNIFLDNTDEDNPIVKNKDLFMRRILGTTSYYRISGTEYFPTLLPINIEYLNMTDNQLNVYSEVRNNERKLDNAVKKDRAMGGLFSKQSSVYRVYSRMACNFVFPDNLSRPYPSDIRAVIKNEMDMKEPDNEGVSSKSIDDIEQQEVKLIDKGRIINKYEEDLNNLLKILKDNPKITTRENLRLNCSPKFDKMIEHMEASPGPVLMYTQFRKMEGINIFSIVLNNQDYKEIEIKKIEGNYFIVDPETTFDPKYKNKRYVIFNEDKIKTNILMNIFNGAYSSLPDTIKQQLPEDKEQLHGEFVKLMMITQSGAEGISLKNVRTVLITEPFWNIVRINQVIGRAVRAYSHEDLPKEEKNVQVHIYLMKFTKEQLDKNFTLKTLDKEMTTDQTLYEIATKKEKIINEFQTMLKASSIDCIINAEQNKPKENGYVCYNWPINVNNKDLAYSIDLNKDSSVLRYRQLQKLKKDKGRVIEKDGIKYIELNKNIYDYFAYTKSGVLLPIK